MANQHTYAGHTLAEIKSAAEAATPGPWNHGFIADHIAARIDENHFAIVATVLHLSEDGDHIATANPATALAMAARIEELERKLGRFERMAACGTVQNWLALPDEDKEKWFALTLARDQEQCKRIAELERDQQTLLAMTMGAEEWPVEQDAAAIAHYIATLRKERDAAVAARREAQMETQLAREERNRAGIEARRGMFKLIKEARLDGWRAAREQAAFVASQACLVPPDGGSPIQEEADLCDEAASRIRAMQPTAEWYASCGCGDKYPDGSDGAAFIATHGHCENCDAAASHPWPHPDGFAGGLTERNHDGQD